MKNQLLKNVFKNMDYNTYKILNKISFVSFPLGIINPFILGSINNPVIETILTSLISLSQAYYYCTSFTNSEKYTKDITDIINLYNEVIERCTNLINTLELEHPIEIYTLYNYMLHGGYLSKGNTFNYGKNDIDDMHYLLGVNVITGKSVCRHIASMLNDIYNKMDINSCTYPVYLGTSEKMVSELEDIIKIYRLELLMDIDEQKHQDIINSISVCNNLIKKYKSKIDYGARKSGDHLITVVGKDGVGYLLDSTNEKIYKKSNNIICKDILKSQVFEPSTGFINLIKKYGNYQNKRDILSLPNSTIQEDKIIIDKTDNLCKNNLDLLDKFRNDNKDLYYEINDKLIKTRKK